MECGLRTMPRPRKRTRGTSRTSEHRESRAHELRRRKRHLHPMPFAGPAIAKAARREILRLARRLSSWIEAARLLEAGRQQAGRTIFFVFSAGHFAQKPHAGKRLCAERDVPPRGDLLRLPRRARHGQLRPVTRTFRNALPRMPWPEIAER